MTLLFANSLRYYTEDMVAHLTQHNFYTYIAGNYRQGANRYIYRDRLLRMHRRHQSASDTSPEDDADAAESGLGAGMGDWNPNQCYIYVDLAHVGEYDAALLGQLLNRPGEALPIMEMAAADALRTLLYATQRNNGTSLGSTGNEGSGDGEDMDEGGPDGTATTGAASNNLTPQQLFGGNSIQIMLRGNLTPTPLRSIQSHHMNTLLKCPGIIISCARVRPRAMALRIRCAKCVDSRTVFGNSTVSGTSSAGGSTTGLGSSSPFSGFSLPLRCLGPNPQECGPTPYAVLPDDCLFVDQQTLKLQEAPEMVPTGEMPRSVLVAVERGLVDKAPPGTRVTVLAIASLFTSGGGDKGGAGSKRNDGGGVKTTYLRVVGMERESSTADSARFSPAEEEAFRQLSRRPDVYDILYRSIAPSISGSYTVDIKKAILCLLFGGSRKRLPDGMKLRGDINVLLLGDPSTAKSQFLKFATRVAPVGVYTSGKGSSAAGLTASVVRDARGEFYLEGGAMVLADGGVVAIDEFDK